MKRPLATVFLMAALIGLPVASFAAVLGISGQQFTVDGQATFLWGPTYFDVLDWRQSDIDATCNAGGRLFRIIVDKQWDSGPSGTESILNNDGSLSSNKNTVHSFIQAADATCGAIVDVVILVSDGSPNSMDWLTSPTVQDAVEAAVVNVVAEFKNYTNVKFDIANEHNADSATDGISTEMDNLVDLAKTECSTCIIDFSGRGDGNPDNWGIDCSTEQATQTVINQVVGTQSDTFNPHLCRQSDWWSKTGSRTATLRTALQSTAKPNLPIYLSEEARVGSIAGGGPEPTEDNLVQAAVNAKNGGAAAYIFHSSASFQMSGSSMISQFTTAELNAFNRIAEALSPGGGGGLPVSVLQTSPKTFTDAGTSITLTLPAPTTPGTKLLLSLSGGHFDAPSAGCALGTLTDSQGGTWSLDLSSPLSTYNVGYLWRRDNTASTQNFSVTLTCQSSSWLTGQLMEVQGLLPGGPDVTASQSGGFNNTLSVTTGSTSQPDTFAVGVLANDLSGTSTITESAGWTVRWEQETCDAASGGHQCGQVVTKVNTTQGPVSHTWTLSQGANLTGGIAVYRAQSGGGGGGGGDVSRTLTWNDVSFDEEWFHLQKRTDQSNPNWIDVATGIAANSTSYIATLAPSESGDCWRIASVKNGWFNNESFIQFSGQNQPGDAIQWSNVACYVPDTPPPPPPPPPAGLGLSGLSLTLDEELL